MRGPGLERLVTIVLNTPDFETFCGSGSRTPAGFTMKSEEFEEHREQIGEWAVNIVSYRIGDRFYCTIDNVDPGARFARAEGSTRAEAESVAREKAARHLQQTRRRPPA
jgi:hypothetical protein